jgi:hypothetical protein
MSAPPVSAGSGSGSTVNNAPAVFLGTVVGCALFGCPLTLLFGAGLAWWFDVPLYGNHTVRSVWQWLKKSIFG